MKHFIISIILLLSSVTLEARVTVSSASYQQFIEHGKRKWVPTTKVIPGTIVLYINTISNKTAKIAKNLVIDNAIPKEMAYIRNSTKSKLRAKVRYSVNNGKSYNTPNRLYIKKRGKRVKAKASDYTNIRWIISKLNPNKKTVVQYRAKLR